MEKNNQRAMAVLAQVFDIEEENSETFLEHFREKLVYAVHRMLQNDFHRLQLALYRIDVREEEVRRCLSLPGLELAAAALADAIIARQMEKMKYFS